MPPQIIKLDQLDTAILNAVKNFSGGPIPGIKGPIINGIIINESVLQGKAPLQVAREITRAIPAQGTAVLKPTVKRLDGGKLIVGFQIQTPL